MAREGIVCRRSWRSETIPWSAMYPGDVAVHHDQAGRIWLLVDRSVRERKIDRVAGLPDGPPGFRWIRVSALTAVDPAFLDNAIRFYQRSPDARAAIGTAGGLQALTVIG